MSADHHAELKNVRSFPSLVRFLRDEMGWPIDTDDFEEITFEYTAEELGIDAASAAKIEKDGIKRLRPLSPNQPWGIFFVKFEPKRLPVVALRRILSRVALKKRASANSDERAAWAADDLLFVSNYGEGDARQISFAHFSQDESKDDLPTLKVLGWDNLDTPLHLDHVADLLTERLAWPDDDTDVARWRESWRSAFTLRHREVITTSKMLAVRLAELARAIRDRIKTVLAIETKNGPVTKLMKAFQEALVHDLNTESFADMYAQTIAYGLLSARVTNPHANTADSFATQLPVTNPFLKELMETFLHVGGRKGKTGRGSGVDFDELGVSEVVDLLDDANMEAVVRDFGDQNPQEDPVIHFYEDFIRQYDKSLWKGRGVIYTPRPVVSYIVRSVHELLRADFGLADGLADTATWGEMAERHEGLVIPDGVKTTDGFVTVLDVATGTGTFLVETIEVIHCTLTDKWKHEGHGENKILDLWNEYVPKYLLPRLHGYELLMAPYAIAHLKMGLKLHETGYRFESDERARIYLTNTLEPARPFQMSFDIPALAHEAEAVNEVKRRKRFTVVIGNPPYSISSANSGNWIRGLVSTYKAGLNETNVNALSDDYVKFLRFAEHLVSSASAGCVGMITNNSYLDGKVHRIMRASLMRSFSTLCFCNLHGSSKVVENTRDGARDENVFEIRQGVAIALLVRSCHGASRAEVLYHLCCGSRESKFQFLAANKDRSTSHEVCVANEPDFFFTPKDLRFDVEYKKGWAVQEVFRTVTTGIKFRKDNLLVRNNFSISDAMQMLDDVQHLDREKLLAKYDFAETNDWRLAEKRRLFNPKRTADIRRIAYRPMDIRFAYYPLDDINQIIVRGDSRVGTARYLLMVPNVALIVKRSRMINVDHFCHVCVVDAPPDLNYLADQSYFAPLYLASSPHDGALLTGGQGVADQRRFHNFAGRLVGLLAQTYGLAFSEDGVGDMRTTFGPEDIFHYLYSVFHSPGYRTRYAEFLKIDFPRLPLTSSLELFGALAKMGGDLVALHLMESPMLDKHITRWTGTAPSAEIEKVTHSDATVWIDKAKTNGFRGVPEEVWNFHIGGYRVCEKWLKDRKGRTLTADDIANYHRVVVALAETIRIMGEIDEVIEAHGGWPAAFTADATTSRISVSSSAQIISLDDARVEREKFKTLLPLYSLKAAAGYFGDGESVEPEGWVQTDGLGTLDERMFVARAIGRSMEPTIQDGDYMVLRANPVGTRQGKIVLAQYHGPADPDTGGAFTIKKYSSEKGADEDNEWRHTRIVLSPLNPEYNPIVIPGESAESFRIIAEFVAVLGTPGVP